MDDFPQLDNTQLPSPNHSAVYNQHHNITDKGIPHLSQSPTGSQPTSQQQQQQQNKAHQHNNIPASNNLPHSPSPGFGSDSQLQYTPPSTIHQSQIQESPHQQKKLQPSLPPLLPRQQIVLKTDNIIYQHPQTLQTNGIAQHNIPLQPRMVLDWDTLDMNYLNQQYEQWVRIFGVYENLLIKLRVLTDHMKQNPQVHPPFHHPKFAFYFQKKTIQTRKGPIVAPLPNPPPPGTPSPPHQFTLDVYDVVDRVLISGNPETVNFIVNWQNINPVPFIISFSDDTILTTFPISKSALSINKATARHILTNGIVTAYQIVGPLSYNDLLREMAIVKKNLMGLMTNIENHFKARNVHFPPL